MNKGDILLVFSDTIEKSRPYIVYDRHIAIGATLSGVSIVKIETLEQCRLLTLKEGISWQKRQKLNDFLIQLLTKEVVLSFKERVNFLKYILWIYDNILDIQLLDNPMPISIACLLQSDKLTHKE